MSAQDTARIATLEAAVARVRSLIPVTDPELIEAGYTVRADDLLAALDGL